MNELNYIQLVATCKSCESPSIIQEPISLDHFRGAKPLCRHCGIAPDLWSAILQAIREPFFPAKAFTLIGARWTIIKLTLRPKYPTRLKFADYGIPVNAKIIEVIFPAQDESGRLFLAITEGNENIPQRPVRHLIPPVVNLYPCFFRGESTTEEISVGLIVTWIPHTAGDAGWQNLIYGFEAYTLEVYESVLVPANVAVELTLSRLLTDFLRFTSEETVKDFTKFLKIFAANKTEF